MLIVAPAERSCVGGQDILVRKASRVKYVSVLLIATKSAAAPHGPVADTLCGLWLPAPLLGAIVGDRSNREIVAGGFEPKIK